MHQQAEASRRQTEEILRNHQAKVQVIERTTGGCFLEKTAFVVQGTDGKPMEKKLEDIKYGDKVLVTGLSK